MRLLVAEDDSVTRRLLQAHLKKWGYEVLACSDGAQAWEILSTPEAPKLVVLDWMMPGMDGVNICREIRKREQQPYTYLILLTGKNRTEDIVQGLEAGADDYIVKPFDLHELKVRVRAGNRVVQLQEDLLAALKASEFQATHDPLTRLLNRSAVLDILHKEIGRAERNRSPLSVVIADVDHFKNINDQHGHLAGDAVLREIAHRLSTSVRSYDAVGRYGGEEFLVVLPGLEGSDALGMAERLRLAFASEAMVTTEGVFGITVSFGIASVGDEEIHDLNSLIRAADEALYRAKRLGRNRVERWEALPAAT